MSNPKQWEIELTSVAERSLRKLTRDRQLLRRIDDAIRFLAEDPKPSGCKKLIGTKYDNLYRIRVGDWRISYAIEEQEILILILEISPRDRAYRRI